MLQSVYIYIIDYLYKSLCRMPMLGFCLQQDIKQIHFLPINESMSAASFDMSCPDTSVSRAEVHECIDAARPLLWKHPHISSHKAFFFLALAVIVFCVLLLCPMVWNFVCLEFSWHVDAGLAVLGLSKASLNANAYVVHANHLCVCYSDWCNMSLNVTTSLAF